MVMENRRDAAEFAGLHHFHIVLCPEEPANREGGIDHDQEPAAGSGPGARPEAPEQSNADEAAQGLEADDAGGEFHGKEIGGDGVEFVEHSLSVREEGAGEVHEIQEEEERKKDGNAKGVGIEPQVGRKAGDEETGAWRRVGEEVEEATESCDVPVDLRQHKPTYGIGCDEWVV